MQTETSEATLERYRHLRRINTRLQTDALRYVSRSALLAQAKRLGLATGKTIVADDDQLDYIFDLVLYTSAPKRTRTIERYARSHRPEPGSDDAIVLDAMLNARFALLQVEDRRDEGGLLVRDVFRQETIWLMDEALEQSAQPGLQLGARIFCLPEGFSMTCGVPVAVDEELLAEVCNACGFMLKKLAREALDDRRFAEAMYRAVILEEKILDVLMSAA